MIKLGMECQPAGLNIQEQYLWLRSPVEQTSFGREGSVDRKNLASITMPKYKTLRVVPAPCVHAHKQPVL